MNQWLEAEQQYMMHTYARVPILLVRGEGCRVWDIDGKPYLDMVAGIATNVLGHAHPVVANALAEQARTLIHTSNLYYTIPQIQLARLLVENSCADKVFYANSGAEANEGAIKLARKWGKLHKNGAYEVISARASFHGRTLATVAATGQQKYQAPFTPMPDGFKQVPYNDMLSLRDATSEKTAAILLEPIQGESGVHPARQRYLELVRQWCDEQNLLLMFDEVQTGVCRTGKLWGYQNYGIEPDVFTMAKGTAGGVPIGVLLCKEKANVFQPGEHASTFGGTPLVTAVAYAVMSYVLENKLWEHVTTVGAYLREKLVTLQKRAPLISEVRGLGLMIGIDLAQDVAKDLSVKALEKGMLLNATGPHTLRLVPPLILTQQEADEAVAILDDILSAWAPA